jgi:5-(carboxyamino)imidazole ribonucleotide synthase
MYYKKILNCFPPFDRAKLTYNVRVLWCLWESMVVQRVGIIGGGQLAWMMASAAASLDLKVCIQTPNPTDTAVAVADHTILAPIDDIAATTQLAQECDWITFENEFVDLAALGKIPNATFRPPLSALAPLLDKYDQRCFLQKLGLPVPKFCLSHQWDATNWQFPLVFKARRHGYDGQGTFIVRDLETLTALQQQFPETGLIEEFVPFTCELAVMAARSITGEIAVYPVVETVQINQVCQRVYTAVEISAAIQSQITEIARTILDQLGTVGIMGIELFYTANGEVLVNELAPRTHNSGHLSIEACATSQFAQHLRAVAGKSLGDPSLTCAAAVMVNLLGYESGDQDYLAQRQQIAALPGAYVHWYDKVAVRPGRKLGHVTVILDVASRVQSIAIAEKIEAIWYSL